MTDREIIEDVKKYISESRKVIDDMDPDEMAEQEDEDLGPGYYNAACEVLDALLQRIKDLENGKPVSEYLPF